MRMNVSYLVVVRWLQKREVQCLLLLACASVLIHLFLIPRLNIVEDESAYVQDALQITPSFLPFRDFGPVKGPFFLFVLKAWEIVFGTSLLSVRMFSSLAHVASIPLLYVLGAYLTRSKVVGAVAAAWWALTPVVVSLTTNAMHFPVELFCIFASFVCITHGTSKKYLFLAALLAIAAFLTRVSAAALLPVFLCLLWWRQDRRAAYTHFFTSFIAILLVVAGVVYVFYGWPKTAFFFNLEALAIANGQRAVYAAANTSSISETILTVFQPLWMEGWALAIFAFCVPFLHMKPSRNRWYMLAAITCLFVWVSITVYPWRTSSLPIGSSYAIFTSYALPVLAIGTLFLLALFSQAYSLSAKRLFLAGSLWVVGSYVFYKGWGRSPTPFYPLESMPVFALFAGTSVASLVGVFRNTKIVITRILIILFFVISAIDLVHAYRTMLIRQYRGTVVSSAAEETAEFLRSKTRSGTNIFTAQPIYPFLAGRPLYKGFTHPGWYLSERAGYLPTSMRQLFLPDLDVLAQMVNSDVDWIVVDWRTEDVYFKAGVPSTEPLRQLLFDEFEQVAQITNPASRDIKIFHRK
jgi:4-amino-4-deoxy-L-arabinose transferase-like glycosyltransferase